MIQDTKYVRSTPYEEFSFQLLVKATDLSNGNPIELPIDFMGDAEIEITTIQLQFSTDPSYMRLEIQSPQLQFDYGNQRYIQITYPFGNHNLASGNLKYKFHTYLNGKININVIDTATKAEPVNFTELIIAGCVRRM
jgi:hypothetical protein